VTRALSIYLPNWPIQLARRERVQPPAKRDRSRGPSRARRDVGSVAAGRDHARGAMGGGMLCAWRGAGGAGGHAFGPRPGADSRRAGAAGGLRSGPRRAPAARFGPVGAAFLPGGGGGSAGRLAVGYRRVCASLSWGKTARAGNSRWAGAIGIYTANRGGAYVWRCPGGGPLCRKRAGVDRRGPATGCPGAAARDGVAPFAGGL
jgi:hypothetical protein